MTDTQIIRGRMLRFSGDPFLLGVDALEWFTDGALAISGGMIVAAGEAEAVIAAHPQAPVTRHADKIIAPGFVDCHMHYPQTGIIASYGEQLLEWLNRYTFPEETRFADRAYADTVAKAFFDETLRNGITTACAYCTIHPESLEAYFTEAAARGLRAAGGKVMMDRNAPDGLRDTAQSGYDQSKALLERWHGVGRAIYAVTPRFAPTSTPEQLEAAGALWAERPDCVMQTHLSENKKEIAWVADLFPDCADYLGVYEKFGLCGPGAVFGHAIHLEYREARRLGDTGAAVAHCPTSNFFIGSGLCDVRGLKVAGVGVGLATDVGGGSSFSPFVTMKAAYEIGQLRGVALSAAHLWWLATAGSAETLRIDDRVGSLRAGMEADFLLLDPSATPLLHLRTQRAENPEEALFALAILGDDRTVFETWANGARVHARSA